MFRHFNNLIKIVFHSHVHLGLPKPIIKPRKDLVHNKHMLGLGYNEAVIFFIPYYSKAIQFQSVGYLNEIHLPISSYFPGILKCQYSDRVVQMKDHYIDHHPCMHSGKHTNCSTKCFLLNKSARKKIHYVVAYRGGGSPCFDTSCN